MNVLVTGSSGHLGEAIMRLGIETGHQLFGMDLTASPFTSLTGSITDQKLVAEVMTGIEAVIHTATLHKPHIATHTNQDFIDTNISGTLNLLQAAVANKVKAFIFTSTTSAFGQSLNPPQGKPAVWITEETPSIPKNIYGATKQAAEELCRLYHYQHQLPCLILRTSRFFPEDDDQKEIREGYPGGNSQANEFLNRRVDLQDAVEAHFLALERAPQIGFGKYIISANSPFLQDHLAELHQNAPSVVRSLYPQFEELYQSNNWRMFPKIDRVYVNQKARSELGWQPKYDFKAVLEAIKNNQRIGSALSREVGKKGYHSQKFTEGPYPTDP